MSDLELSVVAPCLNEQDNVSELVHRVLAVFDRAGIDGELVLVDDGSTDGTWQRLEALSGAEPERVRPVRHDHNRGIAQAWQSGVGAARGDLVALIDADLQYQPEDLLVLRRELVAGAYDMVQGYRSPIGRERDSRYHLSRGFNLLLNGVFGMRLSDNKSGFVMAPRAVMLDVLAHEKQYAYFQSFIMVAAHAKGYAYKEVETLFEARRAGKSFLDGRAYRVAAACLVDLAKAAAEYRLGRFRDIGTKRRREPMQAAPTGAAVGRPSAQPSAEEAGVVPYAPSKTTASAVRRLHWKGYIATFDQTHYLITREVERHYEGLKRTEWSTPSELRRLQEEKLRRLVRHAYHTVPYYRARMRELGVVPDDIRGLGDLDKMPLLTKDDVRKHLYFDILSERHDKRQMLRITTSGSTGEPFICYADRAQLEFRWAATLRSQEWTGYVFGDPTVRLWHQHLGLTRRQQLVERLDAWVSRRRFVPVFELSEARLARVIEQIVSHRPVLVDGYAEALDFLATYIEDSGPLSHLPAAVMSSAQTLSPSSRRSIERAFGAPVFDKYGAREFSGIAYECAEHAGHHVVAEGYIVEILRDGFAAKPGQTGEVVITDLNNYSLPFIRYRIGDLAVAKDPEARCPCGRGLPLIGDIEGRVQSIIQGVDGRYLPGTFFSHYLKEMHHAVRRYQVIQERHGHIRFVVVPGGRYNQAALDEILTTFRKYLGERMEIDVEVRQDVERVSTGKHLASVSRLSIDFQRGAPSRAAGTSERGA